MKQYTKVLIFFHSINGKLQNTHTHAHKHMYNGLFPGQPR